VGRDDFDDTDQLRIGNDGIFMLTFFSKYVHTSIYTPTNLSALNSSMESMIKAVMGVAFVHRPSVILQATGALCHSCSHPGLEEECSGFDGFGPEASIFLRDQSQPGLPLLMLSYDIYVLMHLT
jgi:hypothetical protein